jgi:hypothetical protein
MELQIIIFLEIVQETLYTLCFKDDFIFYSYLFQIKFKIKEMSDDDHKNKHLSAAYEPFKDRLC